MFRSALAVSGRIASGVRSFSVTPAVQAEARPSSAELNEVFRDDMKRRHAYSVNRVELIGGVADTPRKMVAKNGRDYAIFTVITNSRFRSNDGEFIEQADRHSVTAFGKLSEFVDRSIAKGTRVLVHGRLHQSGGVLKEDGTRTPRQTFIHAEAVAPLAKAGPAQ